MPKISLMLLLGMLTFHLSQAQNWCAQGASWYFSVGCIEQGGYEHLNYIGDTIIQGITCNKIAGKEYLENTFGNNGLDTLDAGPWYTFGLRDTVYFLGNNGFLPYIYFSAQAGDTIKIPVPGLGSNNDSALLAIVDSNGKVLVNNDSLRYYYFHFTDPCWGADKATERFGLNHSNIIPSYVPCNADWCYYFFSCYGDDSFPNYAIDTLHGCYDPTLGLSGLSVPGPLSVYPNPSTGPCALQLSGQPEILSATIFDVTGRVLIPLFSHQLLSLFNFDITTLAPGIYFVKVSDEEDNVVVRKLIKK